MVDDPPAPVELPEPPSRPSASLLPPRAYDVGELIGRGGMGEVAVARDIRIGRDIAIKRMHGDHSERAVGRFLREARVQARLQHPAIVPVHDLGTDAQGRLFFTMKRLTGTTLAKRIADREASQPLLRAFVEVVLAIDFAHSRKVVHRDLKPANIMLGDFGEVYVIDWGLARELGEVDDRRGSAGSVIGDTSDDSIVTLADRGSARSTGETVRSGPPSGEGALIGPAGDRSEPLATPHTRVGAVLGTPGYMAPEQVRGEPAGPPADVYALGAILFEILTSEPLHPPGEMALMTTLADGPRAPSTVRADIPPELDALCVAAQAGEPEDRPTAHEMAERLRRYVDGDRDLERRRQLAREQLAAARATLADTDPGARAIAMRHAGRAIALDPESTEAADLVGRLVLEKPAILPPALVASLGELDREALRRRSRRAALSYGTVFGLLAIVPFLNVISVPWLIACNVLLGALAVFAWRGTITGRISPYLSMLGNCLLAIAWTRFASPFVLAPAMICGALIAVASHPWNQERPWTIFAWAGITVLTPFGLEAAGVFEHTWVVKDGALQLMSNIFTVDGRFEAGVLVLVNLVFVLLVGAFAFTITRTGRQASRDLHIQAWHLRQVLQH